MEDAFATFDTGNTVGGGVAGGTGILTGAQFGAGVVGTYTGTKSYDTGAVGVPAAVGPTGSDGSGRTGTIGGQLIHDLGRGIRLRFDARITVAVTSAGAATVAVQFVSADDAALTVNKAVLLDSGAIGKAALVVGYRFRHGSTPSVVPGRFVGSGVVIAGATVTAGTYKASLMLDTEDHADVLG